MTAIKTYDAERAALAFGALIIALILGSYVVITMEWTSGHLCVLLALCALQVVVSLFVLADESIKCEVENKTKRA